MDTSAPSDRGALFFCQKRKQLKLFTCYEGLLFQKKEEN